MLDCFGGCCSVKRRLPAERHYIKWPPRFEEALSRASDQPARKARAPGRSDDEKSRAFGAGYLDRRRGNISCANGREGGGGQTSLGVKVRPSECSQSEGCDQDYAEDGGE